MKEISSLLKLLGAEKLPIQEIINVLNTTALNIQKNRELAEENKKLLKTILERLDEYKKTN